MRERLALAAERYDAGDTTSELATIASWVQTVREVFDLMPTDGEEAAAMPAALFSSSFRAVLRSSGSGYLHASRKRSRRPPPRRAAAAQAASTPRPAQGLIGRWLSPVLA